MGTSRPGDQEVVVMRRQDNLHVDPPQSGQLERGDKFLVRQEIGSGDPDRTPRQVDRGQEDENQLIDLLVRPGDNRVRTTDAGGGVGVDLSAGS